MFKPGLRKPGPYFLFAVRPLPVLFAEASIAAILLAHKEGDVHGNDMRIRMVSVLPERRYAVALLAKEGAAHDVAKLVPAGAVKAQPAAGE